MALKFTRMRAPFEEMDLFGARKGDWTFVISENRRHEPGIHRASVKPLEAIPFDNKRSDLGSFPTFTQAEQACNDFYRNRYN